MIQNTLLIGNEFQTLILNEFICAKRLSRVHLKIIVDYFEETTRKA